MNIIFLLLSMFFIVMFYCMFNIISSKAAFMYGIMIFTAHMIEVLCTTNWSMYPIIASTVIAILLFNKYKYTDRIALCIVLMCPLFVRMFIL